MWWPRQRPRQRRRGRGCVHDGRRRGQGCFHGKQGRGRGCFHVDKVVAKAASAADKVVTKAASTAGKVVAEAASRLLQTRTRPWLSLRPHRVTEAASAQRDGGGSSQGGSGTLGGGGAGGSRARPQAPGGRAVRARHGRVGRWSCVLSTSVWRSSTKRASREPRSHRAEGLRYGACPLALWMPRTSPLAFFPRERSLADASAVSRRLREQLASSSQRGRPRSGAASDNALFRPPLGNAAFGRRLHAFSLPRGDAAVGRSSQACTSCARFVLRGGRTKDV